MDDEYFDRIVAYLAATPLPEGEDWEALVDWCQENPEMAAHWLYLRVADDD